MQRRRLLQIGLGAAAAFAVVGGSVALLKPGVVDDRLTADARKVFRAFGCAVLNGSLPAGDAERAQALDGLLQRVDLTVGGLPRHARRELSQLLSLMLTAPGRRVIAGLGADWSEATDTELRAALMDMRQSSIALRTQAFLALREITTAAYFSDPSTWQRLGYPGPVPI